MALYDNKLWLISHIHNSFMSSDDTGVCEMVMGAENFKDELQTIVKNQDIPSFVDCISDEDDDDEMDTYRQRSPDIRVQASSEIRERGKIPELKKAPPRVKSILWKQGQADPEELDKLFPRKELPPPASSVATTVQQQKEAKSTSFLSNLLDEVNLKDTNPWVEYARFDASGMPDQKFAKTVSIFCPMSQDDDELVPIKLVCMREAKVSDLVGLCCYKYTLAGRTPKLAPPAEKYSVYMCEEDGSVDWDFPALDLTDPFSKYLFTQLALVERVGGEQPALCITINMPDGTFSQMEIQKRDMTLGEVMDKALERRKNLYTKKFKFGYHMEAPNTPGVALDPNTPLNASGETEFYIVRDNSKRVSGPRDPAQGEVYIWDAPLFESFNVEIITKVRTKVEIHLGISGEKVEIDPRQQTSSAMFWSKQKAVSYPMDNIVSCEVIEKKPKVDREVFRMVYLTEGGWKTQDFEGDSEKVAEVVQKLNHLLDMRPSEARKMRKEYLEGKEKKRAKLKAVVK